MSDTERLRAVAQTEIENHWAEATRLKDAAHNMLANAEWHLQSANNWQTYIGELVAGSLAEVIPLQREQAHLTLLEGGMDV